MTRILLWLLVFYNEMLSFQLVEESLERRFWYRALEFTYGVVIQEGIHCRHCGHLVIPEVNSRRNGGQGNRLA